MVAVVADFGFNIKELIRYIQFSGINKCFRHELNEDEFDVGVCLFFSLPLDKSSVQFAYSCQSLVDV